jgi:hypothetical protein
LSAQQNRPFCALGSGDNVIKNKYFSARRLNLLISRKMMAEGFERSHRVLVIISK